MIPNSRYHGLPYVPSRDSCKEGNDSKLNEGRLPEGAGLPAVAGLLGVSLGVSVAIAYVASLLGFFPINVVPENQAKQAQVYQQRADAEERARLENVADRNQLQYIVDTDGDGSISPQEYGRFMDATGMNLYLNNRLTDDLSKMSPNEVKSAM